MSFWFSKLNKRLSLIGAPVLMSALQKTSIEDLRYFCDFLNVLRWENKILNIESQNVTQTNYKDQANMLRSLSE